MPTIFLSYRRSDTGAEAGRLSDTLQNKFGRRYVFRDVVSISPGDHFDAVLETQLAASKVVLVLIGTTWLEELKKRLTEEKTRFPSRGSGHCSERGKAGNSCAAQRQYIFPPLSELPEDLLPLTKCQAITIRDESWKADVDRLIDAIGRPYRWDLLALRIVIAVVVIALGVWLMAPQIARDQARNYSFWRGLVLALIGIYGLSELLIGYRHFKRMKRWPKTIQRYRMPAR